jgi:hypothetical protein
MTLLDSLPTNVKDTTAGLLHAMSEVSCGEKSTVIGGELRPGNGQPGDPNINTP